MLYFLASYQYYFKQLGLYTDVLEEKSIRIPVITPLVLAQNISKIRYLRYMAISSPHIPFLCVKHSLKRLFSGLKNH